MGREKVVVFRGRIVLCSFLFILTLGAATILHAAEQRTILILGDSLSAGYGLAQGTGWASLLEKKLQQLPQKNPGRIDYSVQNASISGETTQGGRNRLAALLQQYQPHILILALGANDGLRGFPLSNTRQNLNAMIQQAQHNHTKVLLVGAQLPPNYGKSYVNEFSHMYLQLAKQQKIALAPSILAGLSDTAKYFQEDRLHPNQLAQEKILATLWEKLQPLL